MAPLIFEFRGTEHKHEVFGKAIYVASHGSLKHLGLDAVQSSQIAVQHHFFTTDEIDSVGNSLDRDEA